MLHPSNSNIAARRRVPKRSDYLYLPVPSFARPSPCFIGGSDFTTMEAARAFARHDELKKAMKDAGVTGAPTIWFTHKM